MNNLLLRPKPFKTLRTTYNQNTFNVKYPKPSSLNFIFTKPIAHRKKNDISLKQALSKKLVCQDLTIQFPDWATSTNQIRSNVVTLAKSLSKSPHIKALNIRFTGSYSLHNISKGFMEAFLPKLRNLQRLQITYFSYSKNFTVNNLIKNVRKLPQLRHLALTFSFPESPVHEYYKKILQSLSKTKNKLQSLLLTSYDSIPSEIWNLLGSTLSQLASLRHLNLRFEHQSPTTETVQTLTDHLRRLENLSVLCINIAECKIESFSSLKAIIELGYQLPKLTSFSFFFREPQYFSDECLLELAHDFAGLTHLKHLTIFCKNLRKTTNDVFMEFLNVLAKLENLKSLELDFEYFRRLKDRGLGAIGDFAAKMPNLSSFRLALEGAKQITDKGFAKFKENLLSSNTIKILELKFVYTSISQENVKEFENMFASKKLLVALPSK